MSTKTAAPDSTAWKNTVAWLDGALVPFAEARLPLEDRGLQFGESLYEVVGVTAGQPRLLDVHARRMALASEVLELEAGVPPLEEWERFARALLERDPLDEGLLYAQVTGGVARRTHLPPEKPTPTFFAYLMPFRFPRAPDVQAGIRACTAPDIRWERCDLKTPMLLPSIMAKREAHRRGAAEMFFLGPDGEVREGASSNVLVVEGRRITSPPRTSHVLPGITGPQLQMLANQAGLEVGSETITRERLLAADEVFVASTTFLAMPVTHVDEAPIGDGKPGPIAVDLAARFRRHLELPEA